MQPFSKLDIINIASEALPSTILAYVHMSETSHNLYDMRDQTMKDANYAIDSFDYNKEHPTPAINGIKAPALANGKFQYVKKEIDICKKIE